MSRELDVKVDKTLCVSNLWCVRNLGSVFRTDADGHAEAFDASAVSEEELVDAAYNCPVGAILISDAQTGEDLGA